MKINNLHTLSDTFKILIGKPLGYKIKYLWYASWRTMPELMCLGIMGVSSIGPLFYAALNRLGDREPRYYRDITGLFRLWSYQGTMFNTFRTGCTTGGANTTAKIGPCRERVKRKRKLFFTT